MAAASDSGEIRGVQVGVDIGGTFTDIVVSRSDGRLHLKKISSTPSDPAAAVINGLRAVLKENGIAPPEVDVVVHGTTVGSNCILERTGARTGLLTTKGFRDVLEIGRIRTPDMFDLDWDKPQPLVRRRLRLEADERIAGDGTVVRPLQEQSVRAAAQVFVAAGVESVAICFLNSYRNSVHEQQAEAILRLECPDLNVTASYAVLPEIKEYERTSTTVVNAYIQPVLRRYIRRLQDSLRDIGVAAPLLVVASNGGILSAEAMGERPVFAVGSGPAAGVAGAARLGKALGEADLIVFDMGGTTAKASLVENGQLTLTSEYEFRDGISTSSRFIKAGGYMLKVPAIDIAEVGAGGGSIAWLDAGGLINVGPRSAGAEPGPACYGLGGEWPTVTDANVVLGHLNPRSLAGGSLKLDKSLAEAAITRALGSLGMDLQEAAHGIRRVANANMARAIRSVSIERGRDPRQFSMIAFGGSGPVHAVDLAKALEIQRVLVPILPGVFTAAGMLASDVEHHFVRSFASRLDAFDLEGANGVLAALAQAAADALAADGYGRDARGFAYQADMRFLGQGSELTVPLRQDRLSPADLGALRDDFLAEYLRTYGHEAEDPVEMVNLRVVATGRRPDRLRFDAIAGGVDDEAAQSSRRMVYDHDSKIFEEVEVLARQAVIGRRVAGPVIVESYDSTIVVPSGCQAEGDSMGNVLIYVG
jgi:N-methylhydantoinase A